MIAVVAWLALAIVASASKFRFMQKSIPRSDFVRRKPSLGHELHTLVFAVKQNNLIALDEMLIDRSTPGSKLYQQWLTFDEVTALTKNSEGTHEVLSWLQSTNITVTWISIRQDYIKAEANISTWENLLNTKFHVWEDLSRPNTNTNTNTATGKTRMMHRATQYSLPEHLTPHLSAVFNTVQVPPVFAPRYQLRDSKEFRTNLRINKLDPTEKSNKHTAVIDGKVTVSFLNELYEISSNTGLDTQSQSVFETAQQSYSPTDLSLFQTKYNIPQQSALHPFGFNTTQCTGDVDCTEGNLDVQYMMGVAQQTATIYWYVSDESNPDPFVAWVTDVANTPNPPLVNSMSWGSIEQANSEDVLVAFNTEALKLSAMGVTVTVSTGDNGAAASATLCNARSGSADYGFWKGTAWSGRGYFPSFPATSPYVTAVGATMGPESGNPEVACQSQLGGVITTGGGFSTYNPTPSWQQSAVSAYFGNLTAAQTPTSGYNPRGRGIPDVSVIGVAYQVYLQAQLVSLYGTSASSPVFAALVSLANAARAAQNKTSLGFLNPTLYAKGTDLHTKSLFNDITSGHNKCMTYGTTCCNSGFYARPGWDPVTGLGSITLPNLLSVFMNGSVSPAPTSLPTRVPTRKPSISPTLRPSRSPSNKPSTGPTTVPTVEPSVYPTELPSQEPTADPTATPTLPMCMPTLLPTIAPTTLPTLFTNDVPTIPTITPSQEPTATPTTNPTMLPTTTPTTIPTNAPTVRPTLRPTIRPTTNPTMLPTATPTTNPTFLPTIGPTVRPTTIPTNPTFLPTIRPTTTPTTIPTNPTFLPTMRPTVQPTVQPVIRPTPAPSVPPTQPSRAPTKRPTVLPTVQYTITPTIASPTHVPTLTPPVQPTSLVLAFTCTVTLAGLSVTQLSAGGEEVLILTIAHVQSIEKSDVTYIGTSVVEESDSRRKLSGHDFNTFTEFTVTATTHISIQLSDTTHTTTTELYSELKDHLLNSVSSGNFTGVLRTIASANNVNELTTATAIGAAMSDPETTNSESTTNNKKTLSTGEIAAMVVAGFAFVFIMLCACMCVCRRRSASVCDDTSAVETTAVATVQIGLTDTNLVEATVVHVENSHDFPYYPECRDVCVVETNPQLAVVTVV